MKTNNWEEDWNYFIDNSGKVSYLLESENEAIKDFIQSLLDKQKEEN